MSVQPMIRAALTPPSFSDLIKPLSPEVFIEEYWQKQPCYIRGWADKFSPLFSWEDLNRLLETHHYEYPRLRMSKFGVDISPKEYLETLPFTQTSRVNPQGLYKHFASGATLLLQYADEFSAQLRQLSKTLQSGLGWYTEIEVIAGCGNSNGLQVHFDGSECLALQIVGTKKWRFFSPTRKAPLRKSKIFPRRYDVSAAPPPAVHSPAVTYEMSPGDFMYVPRGWWHIVEPAPGPCLSINPTIYCATVQDFLQWLVYELSAEDLCRQDIPSGASAQSKLGRDLSETLNRHLTQKRIEDYRTYLAGEMEVPTGIDLLKGANPAPDLLPETQISIGRPSALYVARDGNSPQCRVRWKGNDLHFGSEYFGLLVKLCDGRCHSVADLLASCENAEVRAKHLEFIRQLIDKRLIVSNR